MKPTSFCIKILALALIALNTNLLWAQKSYVFAPSGLNLRESPNPDAKIIAQIPYGAQVSVLSKDKEPAIEVDQITGYMQSCSYLGKQGFLFDGYLSRIPTPPKHHPNREEFRNYAESIRGVEFDVYTENCERDYGGYFQYEEKLNIAEISWREAFLVAKSLYRIPDKLHFPKYAQKNKVIIPNPDKKEIAWTDQMEVTFDSKGNLLAIVYSFRAEATGRVISIKPDNNQETNRKALVISNLGIAD